jgi:cell shape-determining protein MreD
VTRTRLLAGLTAIITVLLLQATVVAPLAGTVAASLPAVLVAAAALVDGPGTGVALGFATGLLADLGSSHPAGVLGLCWMAVGLGCGTLAGRAAIPRDVVISAVAAAGASAAALLFLGAVHAAGGGADAAVRAVVPAFLVDLPLAVVVVPIVRWFLRHPSLRLQRARLPVLPGELR